MKSLNDIVALAKKDGDKLTVGTPPSPTLNYFGAEQFKSMTATNITVVTYKGTGPLTTDLCWAVTSCWPSTPCRGHRQYQAGKLRAIAVAAPERLSAIPDVPTTGEAGMPALDIVQYYGLVALRARLSRSSTG